MFNFIPNTCAFSEEFTINGTALINLLSNFTWTEYFMNGIQYKHVTKLVIFLLHFIDIYLCLIRSFGMYNAVYIHTVDVGTCSNAIL